MAELPKVVRIGDTLTNLIDKNTNQTVTYTKVNNWWDGTPMTASKADGEIYRRKGVEYFLKNLGKYGELFLEKDTMQEMRDLSSTDILLLQMGYYKGVRLNGYYTKGDTEHSLEYLLSETSGEDDSGSIIELSSGIKLEHSFEGKYIYDGHFGFIEGVQLTPEESLSRLNRMYSLGASFVQHTKGVVANVRDTVKVTSNKLTIRGNGFVIRQDDNSGMIVTGQGHLKHLFHITGDNVTVDNIYFDDNLDNNYQDFNTTDGVIRAHWAIAGAFSGATRVGHDVVVIEANNVTVRNCIVEGSSWTAIKSQRLQDTLERTSGTIIEGNTIYNSARDAISLLHITNSKVRNNKVYGSTHHSIHSYINNYNIEIYDNYILNDMSQFYEWYTGIDSSTYGRVAIVLDHGAYPNKTMLTKVYNNTCEGVNIIDMNAGISIGGFPYDVFVYNNKIRNSNTGISVNRGNPIGEGLTATGNEINNVNNGFSFWLADGSSGWQGGMESPQHSKNYIAFNKIQAVENGVRITGSPGAIQTWYDSYELLIEKNIFTGEPINVLDNQINFPLNPDKNYKVIWRNNSEPGGSYKKSSNHNPVNTLLQGSEVFIDTYYPVNYLTPDLVINSMIPNQWYKLMTIQAQGAKITTGTIKIIDRRAVPNIIEVDLFLRGTDDYDSFFRSIARSSGGTHNTLTYNNFVVVLDSTPGDIKYHIYLRTTQTNRDLVIDYSGLYFNANTYIHNLEIFKDPQPEENLPTGANISSKTSIRLLPNTVEYVPGVTTPNPNQQSISVATDVETIVSDFNDLSTKYNELLSLVGEIKTTLNQSIATEIVQGHRRGE